MAKKLEIRQVALEYKKRFDEFVEQRRSTKEFGIMYKAYHDGEYPPTAELESYTVQCQGRNSDFDLNEDDYEPEYDEDDYPEDEEPPFD